MYAEEETRERYKQKITLQKSSVSFSSSDSIIAPLKPFVSCKLSLSLVNLGNLLSDLVFSTYCFTEMEVYNSHSIYSPLNIIPFSLCLQICCCFLLHFVACFPVCHFFSLVDLYTSNSSNKKIFHYGITLAFICSKLCQF